MEIDRRVVVTGALALSAAALIGMPAHANELNLGASNSIKVGSARIFSSGANRILVYRQSTNKFLAYRAICPSDSTAFTSSNIKGTRVTCSGDRRAYRLITGKATSGSQRLEVIKLRVSKGFLLATLASASATPAPTATSGALIASSKVPVGSGVRVSSSAGALMIVQPRAGVFRAFSAVCTHAGCEVTEVTAAEMVCTCHDSAFSTADGAVLEGPARQGLRQFELVEKDGSLFLN